MDYCGLDLGRRSSRFCVVDKERNILREGNVRNRNEDLERVFGKEEPMRIVVEARTTSFWTAEVLRACGHDVRVVDPNRTKAIGSGLIKHDKLDARVLAQLAAAGLLAEVRIPGKQERLARLPITSRDVLVRSRTKIINCIRGMFASQGIILPAGKSQRLVALLYERRDQLPAELFSAVEPLIDTLVAMDLCVDASTDMLKHRSKDDPVIERLQSVPGVGLITASIFVSTIQDPGRFSTGRAVGAYLGLVPRLYQSGSTLRKGRITKHGNRNARWALTMAANSLLLAKSDSALERWARKLAVRVGRKKAICAIARKLANIMWSLWKNETRFEPQLT